MQRFVGRTMLVTGFALVSIGLSGCGGQQGNVLKDPADAKVSAEKGADYKQQMDDAMKGVKKGGGGKPPAKTP